MRNKGKLSEKRVIWIIFTLALTLHLAFAIMEFERSGTSHWADSWEYWDIGRQFADGNWYPSRIIGTGESFVVVAPMLPILVAGGILIFGTSFWPIIILNALAAAAMVVVFYLLGRELFSKTTGYLAAGLSMLDVTFYRYITQVLKEPWYICWCHSLYFFWLNTSKAIYDYVMLQVARYLSPCSSIRMRGILSTPPSFCCS